jgi:ABC-type transporter Mla MlaB component
VSGPPPASQPEAVALVITGPIRPVDIPGLCRRVHALLEDSKTRLLLCDLSGVDPADAVAVDALARLQLTARRLGCRIRLCHPCVELMDLLDLTGLTDVLPVVGSLSVEPRRQPEQREPPGGVQEEADPADPSA